MHCTTLTSWGQVKTRSRLCEGLKISAECMQHFAAVAKHFLYTARMSAILFQHRVYQSLSPWIPAFFDPYCCKVTAAPAFRPFDACSQRESAFSLGTSDFNHMSCKSIIELLWILFRCARTTFRGCVKYAVFSAICHTVRENRSLNMKQPKDGRLPLPRLFCERELRWALADGGTEGGFFDVDGRKGLSDTALFVR